MASLLTSFVKLTQNVLRLGTKGMTVAASQPLAKPLTVNTLIPCRGYKPKSYRKVKSYTFGMGAVAYMRNQRPSYAPYGRQARPRRSGITLGHKIMNYEHQYVCGVGYNADYYKGGPKPRFNQDEKELMHKYWPKAPPMDEWDEKLAQFGQNDYIDILGDGNISIRELNVDAPYWLRGWGGSRFHTVMRQLHFEEDYLLNARPTRWWELRKELTRLYRKNNRYKKRADQRQPLN